MNPNGLAPRDVARSLKLAPPSVRALIAEGDRLLWWFRHPFAQDLEAIESTNS